MSGRTGAGPDRDLTVLKLGGSVLVSPEGFRSAVREVRMELARDRNVCAVVSAMPGTTDSLWRAAHELNPSPDAALTSELLATGEDASVRLLRIALDSDGVEAVSLSARELGLRTEGPPLDAVPVGVDARRLLACFAVARAVVVPGFVGRGADGAATVLGRGGSDLTALFLAHRLGAGCRLIKDVDGLFDSDPNCSIQPARRRYVTATWEELGRVGKGVVQPKAVRFARERRIVFRLAAIEGVGTEIGPGPNQIEEIAS